MRIGSGVSGEKCGRLLHLCGLRSSALAEHCGVCLGSHVLVRRRGTTQSACEPCQSKSVWSLVSGNVHHLVVIQLHAVQVARVSNWILRRTYSALHSVNRCCGCCRCVFTFHFFPSFSIYCHFDPCVVVLPFVSSIASGLRKSFVSSSHLFFWSSQWSVCLVFDADARVPFCCFLCPSFVW